MKAADLIARERLEFRDAAALLRAKLDRARTMFIERATHPERERYQNACNTGRKREDRYQDLCLAEQTASDVFDDAMTEIEKAPKCSTCGALATAGYVGSCEKCWTDRAVDNG